MNVRRHFLLAADAHPPGSLEFNAFPPHCLAGTREAEIIPELTSLPFAAEMVTISKRLSDEEIQAVADYVAGLK